MVKNLSIVIISYNTEKITRNCIESVVESINNKIDYEIVVVDNASTDGSVEKIKNLVQIIPSNNLKIIENRENVGFGRANNQGVKNAKGKYVLFLNSDVVIDKVDFQELMTYLDKNVDIGALTVKVRLINNQIDPASHRGFPTLWRSFCFFSGLEGTFGDVYFLKKIFGGYHLLHNNFNTIHEIDSPSGAFFLIRTELFRKLGGFDDKFFMYGEDLDLAYRIKEQGYKIIYYPKWSVTHLKYQSGLQKDLKTKATIKRHFYKAMKIFYKKHYEKQYFWFLNKLIYHFIDLKEKLS